MALLAVATDAQAAKIEVASAGKSGDYTPVVITGTFEPGDFEGFRQKTEGLTKAIVVFASDGGNLVAGIQIGTMIRLKGYPALVPDGSRCASACALAWLGGVPRVMAPTAKIGFHAAYVMKGGTPETNSAGNALVGAYLNRIGLSDRAVVYITQAAPKDITWLNFADAARLGIEVAPVAAKAATKIASAPAAPAPASASANASGQAAAAPATTPAPAPTVAPGEPTADAAPAPGSPERSAYCSEEADKRDLHGNERRRFRDHCKRGSALD